MATHPNLAKMGMDFCSAPGLLFFTLIMAIIHHNLLLASSVDAERAFSSGCLQVNHLQHNMSSQSFKAQVALGS
jgi:hypothetical protein